MQIDRVGINNQLAISSNKNIDRLYPWWPVVPDNYQKHGEVESTWSMPQEAAYDMQTVAMMISSYCNAVLAICEGNPSVTGGFPSQRDSNGELWYFLCGWPEHIIEQTVNLPVISDAIMKLHNNEIMQHWLKFLYCYNVLN